MENDLFIKGQYIVLILTEGEVVTFIKDTFPFEDFSKMVADGQMKTRPATEEEKEYAFWFDDRLEKNEGAYLDQIDYWRTKYKKTKP